MNWKKALIAGTAAVAAMAFVTGCGDQKQQAQQKLPDKVVIGLDDNFPPMGFRDESGKIIGFDIDLATEAAKRLGVEVEFKPIDWDSKEAALKSKQVDMLWNGLTITDERKQQIAFSKPYCNNAQILVVRSDSWVPRKAAAPSMRWKRMPISRHPWAASRPMVTSSPLSWTSSSAVLTASSSTVSSAATT